MRQKTTGRRRLKRKSSRRREVLGVVILLAGVSLFLSLISYSPTDRLAFDSATDITQNWMGTIGAWIAHWMVLKLGRIPPLLTIILINLWGWRLLRNSVDRKLVTLTVKILCIQILLSIVLAFPHFLIDQGISYDLAGEWGGWMAGILVTYLGIGAPMVWAALLLLFMVVAFGWKPGEIAGALVGTARFLTSTVSKLIKPVITALSWVISRIRSIGSAIGEKVADRLSDASANVTEEEKPSEGAGAGDPEQLALSGLPSGRIVGGEQEIETIGLGEPEFKEIVKAQAGGRAARSRPAGKEDSYRPPSLDMFTSALEDKRGPGEAEVRKEADLLQEKLLSFGVQAEVAGWQTGPVITRFEIKPAPGVKVNQIVNLADDLALAMRAKRIRIVAPIPGKAAVGVEIPNHKPRVVRLREVLESSAFVGGGHILPMAIGMSINGEPFVADLGGMPHLLLAGTTGSGKSVSINSIIASMLCRMGPEECRFIMVDPKMLELGIYNTIPHLITPVVTDPKKALDALRWAVIEMEGRYDRLAAAMVRDLEQYNTKVRELREMDKSGTEDMDEDIPDTLPYIIIIVDELADVMLTASADIEILIQRLAQKARAVGIHLILATQRPSVDVITGPIKTNFSSRIAFQVPTKTDSRTILDVNGAEKLLGKGDMLFMNPAFPEPLRIHGSFISNEEIERLVNLVSNQELETEDVDIFAPAGGDPGGMGAAGEEMDELLRDAGYIVVTHKQGSISLIQRRLGVGYTRAARMMDQLEMLGVVGPPDGTRARDVLLSEEDLEDVPWGGG